MFRWCKRKTKATARSGPTGQAGKESARAPAVVAGPDTEADGTHEHVTPPRKDDGGLLDEAPAAPRWAAMQGTGRPKLMYLLYSVARRKLRYFWFGAEPAPVASFQGLVEKPEDGKLGICCSGGGIRSAAFNLGALQWLQAEGQLEQASYLSAVSGGSYIAAAFSMVAKKWPEGDGPQPRERRDHDSNPDAFGTFKPFAKGSPEEQYLRNRTSYLAPDGAAITYLVLRVLLGLAFNLVFVSLPLLAAGLLLGEYVYRPHLPHLVRGCAWHAGGCKADVHWWWMLPVGVLAVAVLLALAGMVARTTDNEGAFLRTWSVRLLYFAVLLALLLIATPALVRVFHHGSVHLAAGSSGAPKNGGVVAGSAGLAALVLGVLSQLREGLATPKKAYEEAKKGKEWLSSLSSRSRKLIAYLAGGLVGPMLLGAVYVYGVSVALASARHGVRPWIVVVALAAIGAFALLYVFADLTSWSLHPFYKRRLCSAFALRRVFPRDLRTPAQRARVEVLGGYATDEPTPQPAATDEPNGVQAPAGAGAEADAPQPATEEPIAVERDYDKLVALSKTAVDGNWPTLLVCAAANISDGGATPPGRKVTSFTFSPYAVGGPLVGALATNKLERAFEAHEYEDWRDKVIDTVGSVREFVGLRRTPRKRVGDFSLPAAVAMSGAAISPSMGKLTRRPFTFLLALANIRLGVWVPNPRWVADTQNDKKRIKVLSHPTAQRLYHWFMKKLGLTATQDDEKRIRFNGRPRPYYLFMEMLGRNRIGAKYLYVTDGGHYENLGLVELLRRGCTQIYCFDASGDEGFQVLGDAIALARSELDVEIGEINPKSVFPNTESVAKQMSVKLDFHYPERSGGGEIACRLVYARNVLTKGSPWDAQAYHKADPNFPHNSTLDQLYTDQKFEGYRVLGERAGQAAVEQMNRPAVTNPAGT
jgi:hypothetical protein